MRKLNSKGVGVIEILLIIVAVLAVAGIGYYVYNAKKNTEKSLTNAGNAQGDPQKSSKKTDTTTTNPDGTQPSSSPSSTSSSTPSAPTSTPQAKFSAYPQGGSPTTDAQAWYSHNSYILNPSAINLWIEAKNIGDASGSPRCTITARDANSNYTGTAVVDRPIVEPGGVTDFSTILTISNEGAKHITYIAVSCVKG